MLQASYLPSLASLEEITLSYILNTFYLFFLYRRLVVLHTGVNMCITYSNIFLTITTFAAPTHSSGSGGVVVVWDTHYDFAY